MACADHFAAWKHSMFVRVMRAEQAAADGATEQSSLLSAKDKAAAK